MKLASIDQIKRLMEPGAPGNKHFDFFEDKVFKDPGVWRKIWLTGLIEYLEKRQARKVTG